MAKKYYPIGATWEGKAEPFTTADGVTVAGRTGRIRLDGRNSRGDEFWQWKIDGVSNPFAICVGSGSSYENCRRQMLVDARFKRVK